MGWHKFSTNICCATKLSHVEIYWQVISELNFIQVLCLFSTYIATNKIKISHFLSLEYFMDMLPIKTKSYMLFMAYNLLTCFIKIFIIYEHTSREIK
jgi:hypothetical protein